MSITPTQQSFCELNQQITQIVKRYADNQTSYFPNVQKVIEAFERYLECVQQGKQVMKRSLMIMNDCFVFKEKISARFLDKVQRFIQMVIGWQFGFSKQFEEIIMGKSIKSTKEDQPFLSDFSAAQIVFLMYIGLEVERKQILGKDFNFDNKRSFVLKQVIQTLEDCFQNNDEHNADHDSILPFNSFEINEEKLLEKIQKKTFKLRLQKENFSFSPFFKTLLKNSPENCSKTFNHSIINQILKKAEIMEKNGSLVSVHSQFEESHYLETQRLESKKNMNGLNRKQDSEKMGFSAKKFTSEEIFKSIQLRK